MSEGKNTRVFIESQPFIAILTIDSTQDNSELSLALGYNGIERLLGGIFGGRGGFRGGTPPNASNRSINKNGNGTSSTTGTPTTNGNGGSTNFGRNRAGKQQPGGGGPGGLFGVGLLALMLAPAVWAITPILLSKQADTLVAGRPREREGASSRLTQADKPSVAALVEVEEIMTLATHSPC